MPNDKCQRRSPELRKLVPAVRVDRRMIFIYNIQRSLRVRARWRWRHDVRYAGKAKIFSVPKKLPIIPLQGIVLFPHTIPPVFFRSDSIVDLLPKISPNYIGWRREGEDSCSHQG